MPARSRSPRRGSPRNPRGSGPAAEHSARPILVDTVGECEKAVASLLEQSEVAIDLEGVDLGRSPGKLCILQACGQGGPVYLFDITVLGNAAFAALRKLLESERVMKLIWDLRSDCDALHYNHNCALNNVYDLQVLYHLRRCGPRVRNCTSLSEGLQVYCKEHLNAEAARALEAVKARGQRSFVAALGGSSAVWEQRPLDPGLVEYCAADIQHLLGMKKEWGHPAEYDSHVLALSKKRAAAYIASPGRYARMAAVDFELPPGVKQTLPAGHSELIVNIRYPGRVIGRGGATVKSIRERSGCSISVSDNEVRLVGTPEQISVAKALVQAHGM